MKLLSLTLRNWGVFQAPQTFYLEPTPQPDKPRRHLTVISGHNGAGKSTMFQAIALALYGSLALGDRVSRQEYNDFLLGRLHRHSAEGTPAVNDESNVVLTFQYIQSGQPLEIKVERHWRRSGCTVREDLTILQDGEPPDVNPRDYQTWLNDLVPPGLASLCFFDAEQLSALANPERHNGLLSETLRRLLGLDLVDRLHADLVYYTRHRGGGDYVTGLQEEVLRQQEALDGAASQLEELQSKAENFVVEQADVEVELAEQKRRLAAEGGGYAERRPILQEQLSSAQEEIESVANQLRELSAGLLAFALAPELCQALNNRLTQEAEVRRHRAARRLLQERVTYLEAALQGEELWKDLRMPSATRHALSQRLTSMLRKEAVSESADEQPLLHHMAMPDEEQLQAWITLALHAVPGQVQDLGQRSEELQSKRQCIEEDLSRAPDDEVLAPIHAEIMRLETALADLQKKQTELNEEIRKLQFQHDEQERNLERAVERLKTAQASERQLELAERSKVVLKSYQDALTRQRLTMLEEKLVAAFNAICRKEHLLKAAYINPGDFDVQLRGTDGHVLGLVDFSAGERQLYAMALLWALRQVSGQWLPLVIDTPLARLDEIHRWRLVRDYLPAVSEQVILFVTDAELDIELAAQMESYQAHRYRLEYDPRSEETIVTDESQLTPREVALAGTPATERSVLISLEDALTGKRELAHDV